MESAITSEQVLQVASEMPVPDLDALITNLYTIRANRFAPALSKRETELLLKINRGLSDEQMTRWEELIEKREDRIITPEELDELIDLTDQVGQLDGERALCLAELAELRNVPLPELERQLGLEKRADAQPVF